ncbi:sick [Drosophila busckii]|uniref:Sick n=1 Tax=Drosophila busckii TaxID=30019 RepID=A0A0M4E746_DROBS|nr:sick [Drosophila busckii]
MVNRQIAPAYTKVNGGTAIPLPATVMVQRRNMDKVRPLPPTPNHTPSIPGLGKSGSDFNASRPNSPPSSNHTIQSLKSNNNSLRPPSIKSSHQSGIPSPSSLNATPTATAPQKHSMLDKLKLFNKEKQQSVSNAASKTQIQAKRTSSSSGFSSARSERSDSSLSLNDGHNSQLKPPSISVSAQKSQQKHNTKQSKLLAAQQKKEQTKSGKLDKKEKSPARSLHKEELQQHSGNESRSSTMGRAGKSSLGNARATSKSSLHSKSDSRSSLKSQSQSQSQLLHSPNGTSLPKPIAAIKGTSKLPQPGGATEPLKREHSDISASQGTQTNNISQQQQQQEQQSTHILKAPPPYYANAPPPAPPNAALSCSPSSSHISAALGAGFAGYLSEPSTPQHCGIYGSSSRLPPPKSALSAPRKLEYNAGPHILASPPARPRPMHNSAPNTPTASPSKFHTIPSKIVGTIYESKEEQLPPVPSSNGSSVLPMRPLLRGYNSHVTLPTRGTRGGHPHALPHQSYLDFCESDIGQGYCSDGDALRVGSSSAASSRYHDIDNGYLSEGSSGLGHSAGGGGGGGGGKHFLSMMRARQLPTTIEERIRSSRGSLDSIGTAANGSSAASQASSSGGSSGTNSNSNNNNNNNNNKMDGSPHHRPGSRNGRDNWSKMPEPLNGHKADKSVDKCSPSRRSMGGGSGSSSKQGSPSASTRTKGVPPSFGYVKRANGSITATAEQQNIAMLMAASNANAAAAAAAQASGMVNGLACGRTAHVSAVPRTASGRKVAGGTQTLPNDMNTEQPANTQHRSFSLTGSTANQLSQSIRERLATGSHSLPKPSSDLQLFQHRISTRAGATRHDGSLSDTQTYAEVKPEYSSYAMWLKHSNTAGSRLSDGDAIEQLQIGSPAMTRHGHKMLHNRQVAPAPNQMQGNESPYVQSPRMNRSNSIRSTKSEKMYPSMLSRGGDVEIEPYYCLPVGTNGVLSAQMAAAVAQAQAQAAAQAGSAGNAASGSVAWSQPTSPTPINRGPFASAAAAAAAAAAVLSPTHGSAAAALAAVAAAAAGHGHASASSTHRLTYPKKNDEVHGSAASLLSGGSSLYGSAEERQAHEIRRLKRELQDAREQVLSLSSQLSTNLIALLIKSNCSFLFLDIDCLRPVVCFATVQRRRRLRLMTPMSAASAAATPTLHDGYATIRARGLNRSRSIRAAEATEAAASAQPHELQLQLNEARGSWSGNQRKRTVSLRSNYSQSSSLTGGAEELYARAKPVRTPTIGDLEPIYAAAHASVSGFRPLSDASSSSGGGSMPCDYQQVKKNSRFSLDSLQSSATPKTPDYNTAGEEEHIFLYTAPESPKRRLDSGLRSSYDSCERVCHSPVPKLSFDMQERRATLRHSSIGSSSSSRRPMTLSLQETPRSPTGLPPPAPVRRESLYAKPKIYATPTRPPTTTRLNLYELPIITQRSNSHELLERSYTSHSLATIDQDELLVVPSAMPMLPNAVDRRYHTLGHMRVKSMGAGLHRSLDVPTGSMLDVTWPHHGKSAGNIYASADAAVSDLNRMAPEYMDPLDFKIGCQTTLRSKPIIPWYELAIRRDFKRQSCPPISGGHGGASLTLPQSPLHEQAHVVSAFEQSLSNMTNRLQQLTATAERKDGELTDMRQTIELLRKQSIQAGLTTAHMQSMGVQTQGQTQNELLQQKPPMAPNARAASNGNVSGLGVGLGMQRQHSTDSMCSLNSISSGCSAAQDKNKANKKKGWLRSSFTKAFSRNAKISKTSRHVGQHHEHHGVGKATALHNGHGAHGEPLGLAALATQPAPPLPCSKQSSPAKTVTLIDNAKPIDAIDQEQDQQVVEELKKQLREKELVLTDIRLEALSSASQLESLKDMMNKMRSEMASLKQNNERLQKLVTSRSLAGSEVSLGQAISPNGSLAGGACSSSEASRRYSLADGNARPPMELPPRLSEELEEECMPPAPAPEPPPPPAPSTNVPLSPSTHIDLTPPPPALEGSSPVHMPSAVEELPDVCDGKKIAIACYLGQPESFAKYCEELLELDDFYANGVIIANHEAEQPPQPSERSSSGNEFIIACTYISGKTTWQNLDYIVRKTFKDYVARIDPGTNLGLNTDSITSYHLGEAKRGPEMGFPELLPCGYIVGNVKTLYICLQGVGSLAFDSLIPRSIVHRYISLLTEHRRLILCGPSGTGKSYLARRLAEFLVARAARGNPSEAIATFNVDHKSCKDLRQYLGHIAEQAAIANGASELPSVIILDNLHHASALGDVFSCLSSAGPATKLPCIIGTMSQATCNTTNLQLHHNFRWVLTANHMEPVKGFLGRFLRRRLFQLELQAQHSQPELATVLAWLPSVWQHINRFLEVHSSSDVTIGPRLFLSCPLDLKDSQVWFTDIWNYHLSPYLIEAVREGVQLYGRRGGAWNDPSAFIRNSYPWPYGPDSVPPLRSINAEDVGLEGVALSNGEQQDPLLNMLMRLQEAANYSETQEQESDCASLDSNITPDSSAGAE